MEYGTPGMSQAQRGKSGEVRESHGDQVPRSSKSRFKFCKTFMPSGCPGCPETQPPVRGGATIPKLQNDKQDEEEEPKGGYRGMKKTEKREL